jgi:hypothetical protein
MKQFKLLIPVFLLFVACNAFATKSNLFSYNQITIANELNEVTEIENFVLTHENATLANIIAQSETANKLNIKNLTSNFKQFTFDNIDWSAFLWGFCCFPIGAGIGAFVVLLDDSASKDSKISYLIGAGAGFIVSTSFWRLSYYNGWLWY